MLIQKTLNKGFTIVELLIVIVVIAILAAISIVAYNGIQSRARDNTRLSDIKAIQKALELYKVDNGTYPQTDITDYSGTCGYGADGYSYTYPVNNTWMKKLVDGKYLASVPRPPSNSCASFYQYLYIPSPGTSYNCPSRTKGYYVLIVGGADGSTFPSDASSTASTAWRPCSGATAGWGGDSKTWAFSKDET